MERKFIYLSALFLLMLLASGCISEETTPPDTSTQGQCNPPKKMIGQICCTDDNNNGICDIEDIGCPSSCDDGNACTNDTCTANTDFKCVHEMAYPCCGNGECEYEENVNNVCPEDCTVIKMSDFKYRGIPDYMDGDRFVFIHTGTNENEQRVFYLNLTAGNEGMENLRYTFTCNSTQHTNLDSINSEQDNLTDDVDMTINKLDDTHYLVYTNFYLDDSGVFARNIDSLTGGEKVSFHFSIKKNEPQLRDELTCLVKFYFMQPTKMVYKWLKISYI